MATSHDPALAQAPPPAPSAGFFGQPAGLRTLFFTEMWERFSYYGMRALLILFMTATPQQGGLGFDVATAGIIYGLYTSLAYLMGLPGGWLADRFLGLRRAVLYGGILISAGHFSMVMPGLAPFYLGLLLIILGTGLLKPNVSAIVGQLYAPGDSRRDAGFAIFYLGINLGAFLSPLLCGWLGENVNWHYGFAAAGFGMVLGVVQYVLGSRTLGEAGLRPAPAANVAEAAWHRRMLQLGVGATLATVAVVAALTLSGTLRLSPEGVADAFSVFLTVIVVGTFVGLFRSGNWTPEERRRLVVILGLFLGACLFWAAFEQAGSSLNLFAERSTNLTLFGLERPLLGEDQFPASWFQSANSLYIFALTPFFAWLWLRLASRNPGSPAKFSLGLVFVGLGFLILVPAAALSQQGVKVSPLWLMATYFLHTVGELCLSPVGLSAMTKLAPARVAGLTMGIWFLATSVGNFLGGRVAAFYEALPLTTLFGLVALFAIAAGGLLGLFVRPLRRLTGGAE